MLLVSALLSLLVYITLNELNLVLLTFNFFCFSFLLAFIENFFPHAAKGRKTKNLTPKGSLRPTSHRAHWWRDETWCAKMATLFFMSVASCVCVCMLCTYASTCKHMCTVFTGSGYGEGATASLVLSKYTTIWQLGTGNIGRDPCCSSTDPKELS